MNNRSAQRADFLADILMAAAEGDIDSELADCILQAGLVGTIVYG